MDMGGRKNLQYRRPEIDRIRETVAGKLILPVEPNEVDKEKPVSDSSPGENSELKHFERRSDQPLIVIDRNCRVLFYSGCADHDSNGHWLRSGRLTPALEAVAEYLIGRVDAARSKSVVSLPTSSVPWVVRLRYLHNAGDMGPRFGDCYSLTIESTRNRDYVSEARRRFALTRRESEVLFEVLHGASSEQIASRLHLTEGTVQGYYKRLLQRTSTRNRAAMIAAVLGWQSPKVNSTRDA